MIEYIKGKISLLDVHTLDVLKNSSTSSIVKVTGMVFGLLVSVFLGRTLGAKGYGIISLANQIGSVVLIISLLGLRQVIVKEVAIGVDQKKWNHIMNVMFSSFTINIGVTLIISGSLVLLSPYLAAEIFNEPKLEIPLAITMAVVLPQVMSRIFSSALIGFHKIWQSNLVDQTLSYAIIGIALSILWFLNIPITVIKVAIAYAIGRISVTFCVGIYWKKLYGDVDYTKEKRLFVGKKLLKTSLPLLLVGASSVIASNADSIMLGWLSNSAEVGLYVVAAKIGLLTSFLLQVTNSAISPKIAAFYANGNVAQMEIMIQKITGILFLIALIPIGLFLIWGDLLLSLWGDEFINAYWILIIISIGQFFNLSTGAAGLTLMLCGEERIQGVISITFLTFNLILNYFFIKKYGASGAATATAITIALENIVKVIFVKAKIGVLTVPNFFKIINLENK